ncbi:MAG: cytochrome c biogenesis protein CcdA [Candidatus Nanopelagicales bacterium]|nr:cytochrome c biogenesis protein CcdA [Candidatus Nanopelagicales bacterium]
MDSGLLALALVAGAVAAFNPCGFALLPAYLTVLLAQAPSTAPQGPALMGALARAARFATGMTVGFVAVFGIFGLAVSPLALSFERYLPIVTVVVGVALVLLGLWLLMGHSLAIPGLAGRGRGPTGAWTSQVGYGVTFALASLSCTVAPFLAVTSTALHAGSLAQAMAAFIAYALGMGVVVLVLAVAMATASAGLASRMRRAGPVITRLSGGLLVLAGIYLAWYGWFEIRVLGGNTDSDPVVSVVVSIQGSLTRWVASLGPSALLLAAGTLIAGAVVLVSLHRRRSRPSAAP